jgi:hypothetical protein
LLVHPERVVLDGCSMSLLSSSLSSFPLGLESLSSSPSPSSSSSILSSTSSSESSFSATFGWFWLFLLFSATFGWFWLFSATFGWFWLFSDSIYSLLGRLSSLYTTSSCINSAISLGSVSSKKISSSLSALLSSLSL